jgi:hypothetical protein
LSGGAVLSGAAAAAADAASEPRCQEDCACAAALSLPVLAAVLLSTSAAKLSFPCDELEAYLVAHGVAV